MLCGWNNFLVLLTSDIVGAHPLSICCCVGVMILSNENGNIYHCLGNCSSTHVEEFFLYCYFSSVCVTEHFRTNRQMIVITMIAAVCLPVYLST